MLQIYTKKTDWQILGQKYFAKGQGPDCGKGGWRAFTGRRKEVGA